MTNAPCHRASSDSTGLPLHKKILFGLVTAIILFVGFLLALEVACRVVMHFKHGVPGKSYGIYQADDELGATHRPNSYNSNSSINNWGLRNLEDFPETKPSGATRIYCSGGSTTFCYNLDTAGAWPTQLQNKLRKTPGHEKDEVMNGGQITFALAHEFALGRRLIPKLKPDYVLLFSGVNEGLIAGAFDEQDPRMLDKLLADKKWGLPATNIDQARFWKRNSALVRLWDYYIKKMLEKKATAEYRVVDLEEPPPGHPSQHPYVMENLDKTLRAYLAFIRQNGATPIIIRYGDNGVENWYLRFGIRKWRERVVEIGREEGVTICDAASVFENHPHRKECFIESGVHVTAEGADVLSDELKKTLLSVIARPKGGAEAR